MFLTGGGKVLILNLLIKSKHTYCKPLHCLSLLADIYELPSQEPGLGLSSTDNRITLYINYKAKHCHWCAPKDFVPKYGKLHALLIERWWPTWYLALCSFWDLKGILKYHGLQKSHRGLFGISAANLPLLSHLLEGTEAAPLSRRDGRIWVLHLYPTFNSSIDIVPHS